jgi:hypothetical protein
MSDDDIVQLKPFMGLRPGLYLSLIYGAVILAILFFLFIFPGIYHSGSVVSVRSEPWGAAVRLDGVYRGTAPCEFFVPQGTHRLELVLPGFESGIIEAEIPGRLVFSLFFPRRIGFEEQLSPGKDGALSILAVAGAEYVAWTFAGEPTEAYQAPQDLSEGFYRAGPALAGDRQAADELLKAAARFALTRAALRDLLRAKALADNGGLSPSPLSLLHSAEDVLSWLEEGKVQSPETAPWLAGLLPAEYSGPLRASPWFTRRPAGTARPNVALNGGLPNTAQGGGRISAAGLSFTEAADGFYLCETELSAASYDAFLADEPQWARQNLAALVEQGLVSDDYLEGGEYSGGSVGSGPNRGDTRTEISWYAAVAYCQWLSRQLSQGLPTGFEVRLPTEAEWMVYVQGPSDTSWDGLWEWCADPYAPLNFLPAGAAGISLLSSPERVLRGGVRIGGARQTDRETRASLPPEFCSPFVSFRPVIARMTSGGTER